MQCPLVGMQMQGLGASKRGPCVLPGPHAINNAGPAVQMQGPGASMAGGLMAYIAQQQKALQTCTLVLQAGGFPGLCLVVLAMPAGGFSRTLLGGVSLSLHPAPVVLQSG